MADIKTIPEGWEQFTVQELVNSWILDKPIDGNHWSIHPKSSDFTDSWVPFIMASDIKNGKIDYQNCAYISFELNKTLQKWFARPGDVLLSHKATIWRTTIVDNKFEDITLTPQLTYYRVLNPQKLHSGYLFYYFNSSSFQNLFWSWAGSWSTRAYLWITEQRKLPIILPSISEQQAIAQMLSSFDDKIELLREQNGTLEKTAQTIFQEWFGKYGVDDELPEGWRVGKLEEMTEIRGGTTPSTQNPDFWDWDISWTSPKDLSNSKSMFLLQTESKITIEWLKQIGSWLLPIWTLLLSSRAPIWYLSLTNIDVAINQGYIAFLEWNTFSNRFMYLWLKSNMQSVINASNGSTFLEISKSSFRLIDCVIPERNILIEFDWVIKPIFEKILSNSLQIQSLSTTRDELLPKLMSGEVRV